MIAADPAGGLTAGFGVSLALRFSPLAESTDGGSVWSGGILPVALAAEPDALAASGPAQRLALSAAPPVGTGDVYAAAADLSTWSREATQAAVRTVAARTGCRLGALSAVAITLSGDDLAAGACAGGGRAGVFRVGADGRAGPIAAVGPRIPGGPGAAIRVVRLVATGTGTSALIAVGTGIRTRLELATTDDGGTTWVTSAPFATGRPVVATSVTPAGGFVVLLGGVRGSQVALSAPGLPWQTVPGPPTGTAVVVPLPVDGVLEALVPTGSVLDVDLLGASGWRRVQRLDVPVQYGSTSGGG